MLLNRTLWKNAYLLEFGNGRVEDAFTFSVPPQSEEFVYPQRLNETKTFGGSVYEDYGNDTVQITLSGTTINQELKLIWCEKAGKKYMSGEDEIFYLRDLIAKYGEFKNLKSKEIRLYALKNKSKETENHKMWRVWIQNLSIKRSKDKPFAYDYTLKMLGQPIGIYTKKKSILSQKAIDTLNKLKENVQTISDAYDYVSDKVGEFVDNFNEICNYVTESINTFSEIISGAFDMVGTIAKEVTPMGETLAKTICPTTWIVNIRNSLNEMVDDVTDLCSWWYSNKFSKTIENCANQIGLSSDDFRDCFDKDIHTLQNSNNETVKIVTEEYLKEFEFPVVVPGGDDGTDTVMIAHGMKEYVFSDGDTWASIAYKQYGNADYSTMLQLYNSNVSLADLSAGQTIYIPNLNESNTANTDNQVYGSIDDKDQFGHDINLDSGDFAVSNHDLSVSDGIRTIQLAIDNRLATAINARVRNVVYGIRTNSGLSDDSNVAAASYISSSIQETILADPRVDSIESIEWEGVGEQIQVDVTYKTIIGSTQYYRGIF